MISRRDMLKAGATTLAAGVVLGRTDTLLAAEMGGAQPNLQAAHEAQERAKRLETHPLPPGIPGQDYLPVEVPNTGKIPFKIIDGVKVFHMVAMEFWHEFLPGLKAICWGYNGYIHPLLEAVEGDRIRVYVTNRLLAPTTVHWHGFILPNGMDGVGGLTQKAIPPGETYKYEFTLTQHGTLMYHSHHDEMTQMGLGMTGMFVIHPRNGPRTVERDFAIMLHEWRIDPGTYRPNPNEMVEFNMLTMNGKSFPATHPLVARTGQRVRIRLGNLGAMDHHPIHLHNYSFKVVATDGGDIPESAQYPETTVLVAVGQTRTVELVADNPGDWAMHCHMTHHVMNQMGHQFPNMIGVNPKPLDQKIRPLIPAYMTMGQTGMADMGDMGMPVPANSVPMVGGVGPWDYITMGGMFTIFKVRDGISSYEDPGWYQAPEGTRAVQAVVADLHRDGIDVNAIPAPIPGPDAPATVGHSGDNNGMGNMPMGGAHGSMNSNHSTTPAPEQPGSTMKGMNMQDDHAPSPTSAPASQPAVLYTCVMHPQVISDRPGKCPICGMMLVPKK
ncbi:MAG: multicopper oxidase domain-containing protein [Phycisphaerae bacterium]